VEQNLLYNRLRELEQYQCDSSYLKHLNLLVSFLKITYASTTKSLTALLEDHEITYDHLWALFKPNALVYTICSGTGKPRCVKYKSGEAKTMDNGLEYFHLECHYLDFDGKVFGETAIELAITRFRGTKRISSLDAFPLEYHPNKNDAKAHLLECGRKFMSLMGVHHRQYRGDAFFMRKGKPIKVPVNSRVMIDAIYFREANPNYAKPRVNGSTEQDLSSWGWITFATDNHSTSRYDQVRSNGKSPDDVTDDDLIICSPTVPGFTYGNKLWGEHSFLSTMSAGRFTELTPRIAEFAVADIADIEWNPSAFAQLTLPSEQKDVVQALTEAHTKRKHHHVFDDFVVGKGLGLIILLQYRPLSIFPDFSTLTCLLVASPELARP